MVNSKKGGVVITNLPNSGFNNKIHQTVLDGVNIGEIGQSENSNNEPTPSETPMFQKTIGNTLYTVSVYFSQTSKETSDDKILRMLESAVL